MFWNKSDALELVEMTYALVDDHNACQDLFKKIESLFGESKYTLLMWDNTIEVDCDSLVHMNWGEDAMADYAEYYSAIHPYLPLVCQYQSGDVYQFHDLAPPEVSSKWEYVNDFMHPNGSYTGVAATILKNEGRHGALAIEGPLHKRQHWDELEALVRVLNPHLQRVMQLNRQLNNVPLHQSIAELSTDRIAASMIVTTASGRIKFANANARRILSEGAVLTSGSGGLISAATTGQTDELRRLISLSTRGDYIGTASAGGFMSLSTGGGHQMIALVAPLQAGVQKRIGLGSSWPGNRQYAVIFLADPDTQLQLPSELLKMLYKLTAVEAALALHLYEGDTLSSYCDTHFVTRNTARTQLKSIFRKTGVRRQGELIALLNRLSAFGHGVDGASVLDGRVARS